MWVKIKDWKGGNICPVTSKWTKKHRVCLIQLKIPNDSLKLERTANIQEASMKFRFCSLNTTEEHIEDYIPSVE